MPRSGPSNHAFQHARMSGALRRGTDRMSEVTGAARGRDVRRRLASLYVGSRRVEGGCGGCWGLLDIRRGGKALWVGLAA